MERRPGAMGNQRLLQGGEQPVVQNPVPGTTGSLQRENYLRHLPWHTTPRRGHVGKGGGEGD